ncbi:GAD-like domain-containing protein [Vibrio neptunius]|uniref:GAD-like domain-containing protein n=1 Tax=Vibrio neptunius TaxID=170651 RepID=UPI003314D3B5
MPDEDFEMFLEEFGEPTTYVQAIDQHIEAYRGILPDQLLEYWQMVGFSGFKDGLFWITNPAEFEDVLESFLKGTEFADYDNYHVIARNAYGDLYLWGERTGESLEILPALNWIIIGEGDENQISQGSENAVIERFFGFQEVDDVDMDTESIPLFPSVLKTYGPVGKDEVMVFTPYLFMGGEKSVDAMAKENLQVFLHIMADLGGAEIIDMAAMISNVIKHYEG